MGQDEKLEKLREICLALPETSERLSHGEPTFFAGKKTFVMYADHHHDHRLAFWCAAPEGAQELMLQLEPDHFFKPPYVGVKGWIGVYLDVQPLDWDKIEDLVRDAYKKVATPKLLAKLRSQDEAG